MAEEQYDAIIIGAGHNGSPIGRRLGISTCVVLEHTQRVRSSVRLGTTQHMPFSRICEKDLSERGSAGPNCLSTNGKKV